MRKKLIQRCFFGRKSWRPWECRLLHSRFAASEVLVTQISAGNWLIFKAHGVGSMPKLSRPAARPETPAAVQMKLRARRSQGSSASTSASASSLCKSRTASARTVCILIEGLRLSISVCKRREGENREGARGTVKIHPPVQLAPPHPHPLDSPEKAILDR